MCLAIPVQVTELLDGDMARVRSTACRKTISLALVEDVRPGDYVILHVGYALNKTRPRGGGKNAGAARRSGAISRSARMKYVDEYRDGKLARAIAATITRRGAAGAILSLHGILRRPHPRHRALRA